MDDAALVAAMTRRDPQGLDGAYRRYADPLFAYARSLLGDRDTAADIVHDTFLLANQHVAQLRDPHRLRQWLYAIARNEGMRQVRRRSRQAPLEAAPEMHRARLSAQARGVGPCCAYVISSSVARTNR